MTPSIQGEVYALPGTIQPFENDFFTVDYLNVKLLFRVSQVSADRVEGSSFFKLQYFLDQGSVLDLEQQVVQSFQFEIANVGSNSSPLIQSDVANASAALGLICDKLKAQYWKAFHDRTSGSLILRGAVVPTCLHDNTVDLFVKRNDVLSSNGYLQNRTVNPMDMQDYGFYEQTVYPQTLYWLSENRLQWPGSGNVWTLADLQIVRPPSPLSQFFELAAVYGMYEAVPVPAPDGNPNYQIGGPGFAAAIDAYVAAELAQASTAGILSQNPACALAQRCLAGDFRPVAGTTTYTQCLEALADAANNTALLYDRASMFWMVPIVLNEAAQLAAAATATSTSN